MEKSKQLSRLIESLWRTKYSLLVLVVSASILVGLTEFEVKNEKWTEEKIADSFSGAPDVSAEGNKVAVSIPQNSGVQIHRSKLPVRTEPNLSRTTVETGGSNRFLSSAIEDNNLLIAVQNGSLGNRQLTVISEDNNTYQKTVIENTDSIGQNPGSFSAVAGNTVYFTSDREEILYSHNLSSGTTKTRKPGFGLHTEATETCTANKTRYISTSHQNNSVITGTGLQERSLAAKATSLAIDSQGCGFLAAAKTREDNVVIMNRSTKTKVQELQRGRVDMVAEPSPSVITSDIYGKKVEIQRLQSNRTTTLEKADLRTGYVSLSSAGRDMFAVYTTQDGVYYAEKYVRDNRFRSKAKQTASSAAATVLLISLIVFLGRQARIQQKRMN
jgi:hypothetical protein